MGNVLDTYDKNKLAYEFTETGGETFLSFGDGTAKYHLQIPNSKSNSNVDRIPLPAELRTADTALAVFQRAVLDRHMSRDGKTSLKSSFPQISAKVRLSKPLQGKVRMTAAVWATRKIPALDKIA